MASVSLLQRPTMSERIERVRRKAETIWKKPLLRQYTDHTIDHSLRVIAVLDKLCALVVEPLTDDETYVLLCAAFLHDIGMQQEKSFETDVVRKRYSGEEIAEAVADRAKGEAIIREWHHLIGEERIKYELGHKYMEEELIDEIALVSKGHTKEDLDGYKDGTKAGQPMRLRLLAALLRLADELDLDYRRIVLDELKQANIPTESKAHWWKCHYVESVDVHDDGRIQIVFRFSEKDGEEVARIVPILVLDRLGRKLHQEGLLDILWPYIRIRLDETPKIDPPAVGKRPVPEEALEIFKREVRDLALQRAAESTEPVAAFASGRLKIAFGQSPENLMRQGIELWREGERDNVIAILERGASLYPNFAPLQALLAHAYVHLEHWGAAKEAAQKTIDSDAGNFLGRLSLGIVLSHQGDYEGALEHLRIAELASYSLGLQPTDRQRLHLAIARSLAGLGDYWYARRRMEVASELVRAGSIQADKEIETELSTAATSIEGGLEDLEIQEGQWEIQDLAWQPVLGHWSSEPPFQYEKPTALPEGILLGGRSSWIDYIFECEFQLLSQAAGFFVRADARAMTGLMMQFTPSKLRRHQELYSNYFLREITEANLPASLDRQKWYKVRFEISGNILKTYLGEHLIDAWTDFWPGYTSGKVGFRLHLGEFALYRTPRVVVSRMAVSKPSDLPAA